MKDLKRTKLNMKLTVVPIQVGRSGERCFWGPTDAAFIPLECGADGKPLDTVENRDRIRKATEFANSKT